MKRLFKVICWICLLSGISWKTLPPHPDSPFFNGKEVVLWMDSTSYEEGRLTLIGDDKQQPIYFRQDVFTPVCRTNECLPAEIYLYWDVAGTFLGYKLLTDAPLTKVEHAPFTENDYFQLYLLLNNPASKISKLTYDDLTSSSHNAEEPDGVSGATSLNNKDVFVPGAVFTCFTLWHLVNAAEFQIHLKNTAAPYVQKMEIIDKKVLKTRLKNLEQMDVAQLTFLLQEMDRDKLLRKFAYQKLLTENINQLPPLKALLINNYITRQVFVFPEIEERLHNCKSTAKVFEKMLNGHPNKEQNKKATFSSAIHVF